MDGDAGFCRGAFSSPGMVYLEQRNETLKAWSISISCACVSGYGSLKPAHGTDSKHWLCCPSEGRFDIVLPGLVFIGNCKFSVNELAGILLLDLLAPFTDLAVSQPWLAALSIARLVDHGIR